MARHPLAPQARRDRLTGLSVRQAVALGLMQGPAELLPVSSSGHLVLVPALLGWRYAGLDADVRKAFEVALHAGAGAALGFRLSAFGFRKGQRRTAWVDPLLVAPAAAVGGLLEPVLEQRLSDPRVAAAGQIAAGIALALTDSAAHGFGDEPPLDAPRRLAIGVAQAAALVPGVSRNGATLTAARALGFSRARAQEISWRAGLPIIAGATALKGLRLAQRGLAPELRAPFAAGACAAFASTLAAAPLLRLTQRSWAPIGAYRVALGATSLVRLHRLQWAHG